MAIKCKSIELIFSSGEYIGTYGENYFNESNLYTTIDSTFEVTRFRHHLERRVFPIHLPRPERLVNHNICPGKTSSDTLQIVLHTVAIDGSDSRLTKTFV